MELQKVICSTPEEFSKECQKWAGKGVVRGRKLIAYGIEVAELITTRGGKREGAGAKPRDGEARVNLCCRVSVSTKQWLDEHGTDGI